MSLLLSLLLHFSFSISFHFILCIYFFFPFIHFSSSLSILSNLSFLFYIFAIYLSHPLSHSHHPSLLFIACHHFLIRFTLLPLHFSPFSFSLLPFLLSSLFHLSFGWFSFLSHPLFLTIFSFLLYY